MLHVSCYIILGNRAHTHAHTYIQSRHFLPLPESRGNLSFPRCPICMGNNFVWLPRRLLQLTVTSSVNRAQREIYTFFRILIKWHHLSQSAARTPSIRLSVCRSLLPVACLHIAIFSVRDSRDDAYEMRLSLIAAHMQRRVFHTHTHRYAHIRLGCNSFHSWCIEGLVFSLHIHHRAR